MISVYWNSPKERDDVLKELEFLGYQEKVGGHDLAVNRFIILDGFWWFKHFGSLEDERAYGVTKTYSANEYVSKFAEKEAMKPKTAEDIMVLEIKDIVDLANATASLISEGYRFNPPAELGNQYVVVNKNGTFTWAAENPASEDKTWYYLQEFLMGVWPIRPVVPNSEKTETNHLKGHLDVLEAYKRGFLDGLEVGVEYEKRK